MKYLSICELFYISSMSSLSFTGKIIIIITKENVKRRPIHFVTLIGVLCVEG